MNSVSYCVCVCVCVCTSVLYGEQLGPVSPGFPILGCEFNPTWTLLF